MQTVKQIVCMRCRELNSPHLMTCAYCGQSLGALGSAIPTARPLPRKQDSDLPALLWTLVCLFVALWGLVAAGPLEGLLGVLTHPYFLLAAATASLLVTGLFLSERILKERPRQALLSTRELMMLSWTAVALLSAGQLLKYVLPRNPVITRYDMVHEGSDGCRVEVFVRGHAGDELWRLTAPGKRDQSTIVGVIVRRAEGGSFRLPETQHTSAGDCAISKYHLMVNGRENDSVDGVTRP
jgi:hypothetical protein